MMKKLLLFLMACLPYYANAYDFEVDGIYYNLNGTEVTVTFGNEAYTESVVIPSSVKFLDVNYKVSSIGGSAFSRSSITSVTIPNSVTSIDNNAFYECSGLTSISIPNSVASIGSYAFEGCSSLTTIIIPDSVTYISQYAFQNCSNLVTVKLPQALRSIGQFAFYGCSNLTEISIPENVTFIGNDAFRGCSSLKEISLPSGLTYIYYDSFCGCTSLSSIEIPNGVKSIGNYAFSGCENLKNVSIPNSVTYVGYEAFFGCEQLPDISLPDSLTDIGGSAFYRCKNASSISIPASLTNVGNNAFAYCYVTSTNLTNKSSLDLSKYGLVISDREQEDGLLIKDSSAVFCRTWATDVTIPNSVRNISDEAFDGCTILKTVYIPDGVVSIGKYAFYNCSNLSKINLPSSLTSIGSSAFSGCYIASSNITNNSTLGLSGLTKCDAEQPDGLLLKGNYARYCRKWATSVSVPDSILHIYTDAFTNCTQLSAIKLSKNLNSIGKDAFSGCTALTTITIPSYVRSIDDYAFRNCSNLSEITIPNNIQSIGTNVFPSTIKSIFVNVQDISNANILSSYLPSSATWTYMIDGQPLKTIPSGTKKIGDRALINYSALDLIEIPQTVVSIGDGAFNGCNLTTIDIPSNVETIGDYAFYSCKLRTVVAKKTNPSNYGHAFSDLTYAHATLYIPEGTFWTYVYDSGWGMFDNIKEMATEVSQVKEEKCYMLADVKGCNYSVWDEDTKELKNVAYTYALDEDATGTYWQVHQNGNQCTLYNIGANQYGSIDAEGNISLSTTPVEMSLVENNGTLSINGTPRMLVVSQNESITPVQNVKAANMTVHDGKFIQDGHVIINKNGHSYNTSGTQIK